MRNYINDVCCLLIARGIYVGAYGIRPVHHRPTRAASRRPKFANPRNSGRMPYAPTAARFAAHLTKYAGSLYLANCRGVWHTPCTPSPDPRRKPPPQNRKSAQFWAYAIRPYIYSTRSINDLRHRMVCMAHSLYNTAQKHLRHIRRTSCPLHCFFTKGRIVYPLYLLFY